MEVAYRQPTRFPTYLSLNITLSYLRALLISTLRNSMDWSKLAIVQCDAAQTRQSRRNHFVQWGKPLGFDEHGWVERFTLLEQGEWADEKRYITW